MSYILEQAKQLEHKIKEVDKHLVLMSKIVTNFVEAGEAAPPVCVKTNSQYSNYMPLDPQYLPDSAESFYAQYIKNIESAKARLQTELDQLLK